MVELSVDTALIVAMASVTVTIILALLNATIFETRRQLRKLETEKTALREALYSEIGSTVRIFTICIETPPLTYMHELKTLNERMSSAVSSETYRYTRENPVLFYQLHDAGGIESFYQIVRQAVTEFDSYIRGRETLQKMLDYDGDVMESLGLPKDPLFSEERTLEGILRYTKSGLRNMLIDAIEGLEINKLKDVTTRRKDLFLAEKSEAERETKSSQFIKQL